MPTMEIDGKKVAWEGKKMILQVALDNNIEIPHYCYHPGLSIVASCRICLGEIESPDPKDPTKLVKVPKLIPTCQTPLLTVAGRLRSPQEPRQSAGGHEIPSHQPPARLPRLRPGRRMLPSGLFLQIRAAPNPAFGRQGQKSQERSRRSASSFRPLHHVHPLRPLHPRNLRHQRTGRLWPRLPRGD